MTEPSRRQQNRIERERRILEAALTVFAEAGYTGAAMDAVAAGAGISKPTLYQYFDSKEALFSAVMRSLRNEMLDVFSAPSDAGMVHDLHDFAWDYAEMVMRPDLLSLARLTIGEVQRFPEIGAAYQSSGPDQVLSGMMEYLAAQRELGRLRFTDSELAAQDLWGLILSAPRNRALHDPGWRPSRSDIARYLDNGLRVFLRAYSTGPDRDLNELEALIKARETPTGEE